MRPDGGDHWRIGGFVRKRRNTRIGEETPALTRGINPGEIICVGKRLRGAISYLHQYATEDMLTQNNWQSIPSSKSTYVFTDLTVGNKYYCRIAAVGSKQQLVYSDVVNRVVA